MAVVVLVAAVGGPMADLSREALETLALMGFLAEKPAGPPLEDIIQDFIATAYCPDAVCTGPSSPERGGHGLTASGRPPQEGRTIAVDPSVIPMGELVEILGLGLRRAEDTGSAIKGNRIDLFMADHEAARRFGRQSIQIRRQVKRRPPAGTVQR